MPSEPPTALIIEDEPLLAMELQLILEGFGFEVCDMVATEDDAVEAAFSFRPDLVTVDVNLKEGNGIQAVKRISEQLQPCFIYISAERKLIETEIDGALCADKPFDANQIARVIRQGLPDLPEPLSNRRSPPLM